MALLTFFFVIQMSNLRPRDDLRNAAKDFNAEVRHRQPDASILEHDRKRKIEVKCLELRLTLEDEEGLDEDAIEAKVQELRTKLLAQHQPLVSNKGRPCVFILTSYVTVRSISLIEWKHTKWQRPSKQKTPT